jgi:transglutaminase-like putative cysteine protease
MRRPPLVAVTLAALAGGLASIVSADDRPVLHEDFRASAPSRDTDVVGDPAAGKNPTAIASGGKLLPEPPPARDPGEPIYGKPGVGDRRATVRPDATTTMDGTLSYVEVFNPAIVPFKRMNALDGVRDDFTLIAADTTLLEVAVGGQPRPAHDRFWGSLRVELAPGVDVAIPSVAADMRILSYETTPHTTLTFSHDGADNYYVKSDEPGARGVHRIVFLAEVDPRAFAPVVPGGVRVDQLDRRRVRPLPEPVREGAHRALRKLGLTPRDTLAHALDRLVEYHRSFAPGTLPELSGDLYWDLFDAQLGVCRHRAYTFMITANALGIPTRFVSNEAHAWVEVDLPGQGWSRIDLGGAALELEVQGGDRKTMYRPAGRDPFPTPPAYQQTYSRLDGPIDGLTPGQRSEAREPREAAASDGGRDGTARDGRGGFERGGRDGTARDGRGGFERDGRDGTARDAADSDGAAADAAPSGPPSRPPGSTDLPTEDPVADAGKQATRTRVVSATGSAFRGDPILVQGTVDDGVGHGVGGLRVDVYLARRADDGGFGRQVGSAVTDERGRFALRVALPRDLELTTYQVYAATPGDPTWRASLSK